jgi:hypothetical protein
VVILSFVILCFLWIFTRDFVCQRDSVSACEFVVGVLHWVAWVAWLALLTGIK